MPSSAEVDMFILKNGAIYHTHFKRKYLKYSSKKRMSPRKSNQNAGSSRINSGKQWKGTLGWGRSGMPGEKSVWVRNERARVLGGWFWVKGKWTEYPMSWRTRQKKHVVHCPSLPFFDHTACPPILLLTSHNLLLVLGLQRELQPFTLLTAPRELQYPQATVNSLNLLQCWGKSAGLNSEDPYQSWL